MNEERRKRYDELKNQRKIALTIGGLCAVAFILVFALIHGAVRYVFSFIAGAGLIFAFSWDARLNHQIKEMDAENAQEQKPEDQPAEEQETKTDKGDSTNA